ncbi:MAG: GNAT family N-acetyltransferase [Firmicutes bacterium]|nr:GNAT family N-acetyltransferase [Bacillota bacterium]
MIDRLTSFDSCLDFIHELNNDPCFSDPMLSTPGQVERNLMNSLDKPNDHVLGVYENGEMTGLFDFLIMEEDRYIEMIVGLSRSAAAYEEIMDWLKANYPGYQADFVFNPANRVLKELLERNDAEFDKEQQKMVLHDRHLQIDTTGIELLSKAYEEQYKAIHGTEVYWTAERVIEAPERFRVLLAVEDGHVLGYIDITKCFDDNEPFDVWVEPSFRRRGWGRKLVAKAIELNRPADMMLLVEVDNTPAICLYESLGFEKVEGKNNQTVTWRL